MALVNLRNFSMSRGATVVLRNDIHMIAAGAEAPLDAAARLANAIGPATWSRLIG